MNGTFATIFYDCMFGLSVAMLFAYLFMWHKHFDVHMTILFILVPITNLSYCWLQRSTSLGEALIAKKISYFGGCFLFLALTLLVFSLCRIHLKRWMRLALIGLGVAVFLGALSTGYAPLFYKTMEYAVENGIVRLHYEYGFLHNAYYVMVGLYFALDIGAMIYSWIKKKETSRTTLKLLFFPVAMCVVIFFVIRPVFPAVEWITAGYNFCMFINLFISHRLCLYDITETAADSLVENGSTGIVSFDKHLRFLGSNRTAKVLLPALAQAKVDRPLTDISDLQTVESWLEDHRKGNGKEPPHLGKDGRIYRVDIGPLIDGKRERGYQMRLTDDTENIRTIADLNDNIIELNDRFILAMASMVESRDNSTGGHIRRTSDGVRILTEELKKEEPDVFTDAFCRNLIKAAPMHDLGKIAVDDAILRKPGRFTPEEFEQMKKHAPEGARIVRTVLEGVESASFRQVAERMAHYHHERWDGSGYPDGLKGEEIPLEARVMAVADVYDALVSKRVYKEKMSFGQADELISSSFGTQFDPALASAYAAAKNKLEDYYRTVDGPSD